MPPAFFGPSHAPLYGVLELPGGRVRQTGVLLLAPGLQDYNRSHWALRSLAAALGARGFPTLRFDYRGMGDSWGEPGVATVEAWAEDAGVAAQELKDSAGVQQLVLLGLRLGAAVAVGAAAALPWARRLVLWNPVVRGAAYLAELAGVDQAMRLRELHSPRRPPDELGGYHFPAVVRASVERVDLCRAELPSPRRVTLLAAGEAGEVEALRAALAAAGHTVTWLEGADEAERAPLPDVPMLAQGAVAALVAHLAEVEA